MRHQQVQAEWRRAQKVLQAAELLQQHGLVEDAISRAYYAIMHAAKAALLVHTVAGKKGEEEGTKWIVSAQLYIIVSMENTIGITKAAEMLGVTVKTLQRWDREGRLVPIARTRTNRRVYTVEQVRTFQGLRTLGQAPTRVVLYCRVSSQAQKPDLVNQRAALEQFCAARGLANVEVVSEVGGGLNFTRKKFVALMQAIDRYEVKTLVVAHKDRLVRFGFCWFAQFCADHGCELLVLNQETLSPEQEMVQDLMTIVHCFSSRLYGLRHYRKTLADALKGPPA